MDQNNNNDLTPRLPDNEPRSANQEPEDINTVRQAQDNGEQVKTPDQLWAEKLGIPATPPPTPVPPPNPQPVHPRPGNLQPEAPLRQSHAADDQPQAPASYLIWSIVMTLFCCFIPGIIAIVFSSQVSSRWYAGDAEGAEKASRRAQIWILISFVLGLVSNTIAIPLMMVG